MTSLDTTAVGALRPFTEGHEVSTARVAAALREDEILEYSHSTHGCDFSGIVVQLGSAQTPHEHGIHLGDHVVGFIRSTALQRVIHADTNARYIRLAGELAWKVPRGTFTHEQAAKRRLGRFRYMFGAVSR